MGKPFITRDGYEQLRKELDYLWEEKRPEVTQKVSWAASLGDRSENADYQYNKRLLGQIDRRIRYLRTALNKLQVIEFNKQQEGKIFFGAYVEIESEEGEQILRLRIVGGDEIFGRSNCISVDSPMAKAMLGKSEGDDIVVHTPKGQKIWFVNAISYAKPSWYIDEEIISRTGEEVDLDDLEEVDEEDLKKIQQDYLKTMVK